MDEKRYFVYVKGIGGEPTPQLWYDDLTKGTDRFQHKPVGDPNSELLYFRQLDPYDFKLTLGELTLKYPYLGQEVKTQ